MYINDYIINQTKSKNCLCPFHSGLLNCHYNFISNSQEYDLMLTVSCREAGFNCDYVCKGDTEEELMKDAGEHAMKDHDVKPSDMTPEMTQKIKSLIRRS